MRRQSQVRIRSAHKSFGETPVLRGIDLDVAEGTVASLIGPSGSGKSTLLRCINALEVLDSGSITIGEHKAGVSPNPDLAGLPWSTREAAKYRSMIGMVFQHFNLFPHRTAIENVVEAPIRVAGRSRRQADEEAYALLEKVGLRHKADEYPHHLSGGQQQRVAIARMLAMQPRVLLFDEATSALDQTLAGEVLDVIRGLAEEGRTMIVVTHDLDFAREVSDEVAVLDAGRIVQKGPTAGILRA